MSLAFPSMPLSRNLESSVGMSPQHDPKLASVLARVAAAEKRAGRSAGSVTLIVVSKNVSAERVAAAAQMGAMQFGENYVQEALKKIDKLKILVPQTSLRWHLIGALQTNKSKSVIGKFDTIQSVDRLELAAA